MYPKIKVKDEIISSFRMLKRRAMSDAYGKRVNEGTYSFTTNNGHSGKVTVEASKDYKTKTKKRAADGKAKRTGGGVCASGKTMFNTQLRIVWDSSHL